EGAQRHRRAPPPPARGVRAVAASRDQWADRSSRIRPPVTMTCLRCHTENPPEARFCLECAARLPSRCSSCRASLPGGAKFCVACAPPVESPPEPAPPRGAPDTYTPRHLAEALWNSRAALEGERKQVTVLFADVKGSMELLADRDPEEARRILDPV